MAEQQEALLAPEQVLEPEEAQAVLAAEVLELAQRVEVEAAEWDEERT
ncbi:MAG: hypothetical protein Q7R48_02370 [bacterium]|nr:hypothetical protein [bacterium]